MTRRVNRKNVWQAVYTAGVVLPKPVAECRYYHRSLNPKKLIEVPIKFAVLREGSAIVPVTEKQAWSPHLNSVQPGTCRSALKAWDQIVILSYHISREIIYKPLARTSPCKVWITDFAGNNFRKWRPHTDSKHLVERLNEFWYLNDLSLCILVFDCTMVTYY